MNGNMSQDKTCGTVGIAALATSHASSQGRPSRAEWDRAVTSFEAATGTLDTYSHNIFAPAERAYFEGKRNYPEFCMHFEADEHGPEASLNLKIATVLAYGEGKHAGNGSRFAEYAATQMPTIWAIDAYNQALRERLNVDALEAEYERLLDAESDARDVLFSLPAPDWQALTYKLRLLAQHSHLASENDPGDPLPLITADAERLAAGALS